MKRSLFGIFILAALFTFSCALKPVYLTEQDNGKEITVRQGTVIQIELRSNPSAGYDWYIKEKPSNLTEEGAKEFFQSKSKKGIVGIGGTTIFKFKASKKGTGLLAIVYERKWEGDLPYSKKFVVKINIQ